MQAAALGGLIISIYRGNWVMELSSMPKVSFAGGNILKGGVLWCEGVG